jgi:tripartite ATP-independent transporter DctM subunit
VSEGIIGLLILVLLIGLVILRVPVSFALMMAALPPLLFDAKLSPPILMDRMRVQFGSVILTAIPFFILAANLMNRAGITDKLMTLSMRMVGFFRGGLGYVNIMVSMFFAGISGSSNADAAGIGSAIIPAMKKQNYDTNYTVAVTACSAVMGCIIPPSIMLVIWASTMSISVAGLLLAGIFPGILIGLVQMLVNYFYSRKRNYPKYTDRFSWKELVKAARDAFWALLTPVIIVWGIVGGIVTPTEASAIAVFYALIVGVFVYRTLSLKDILEELISTAKLTAVILFAIGTAAIYGWVFSYYRVPSYLVDLLGSVTQNPTLMLTLTMFCFLIAGCFLDAVPAIILLGPLLQPVVVKTGVDPMHFAIVSAVTLGVGLITPPYGLTLLISSKIAGINCMQPIREVAVFFALMFGIVAAMILFPDFFLILPRLISYR